MRLFFPAVFTVFMQLAFGLALAAIRKDLNVRDGRDWDAMTVAMTAARKDWFCVGVFAAIALAAGMCASPDALPGLPPAWLGSNGLVPALFVAISLLTAVSYSMVFAFLAALAGLVSVVLQTFLLVQALPGLTPRLAATLFLINVLFLGAAFGQIREGSHLEARSRILSLCLLLGLPALTFLPLPGAVLRGMADVLLLSPAFWLGEALLAATFMIFLENDRLKERYALFSAVGMTCLFMAIFSAAA